MKIKLKEVLVQSKHNEYIEHPEVEKFVTVSGHGQGVKERIIGDGKTPVPFNGYRVKSGQLIYSRIGASDGAFGVVPDSLNNAVVSKDFPVFDIDSNKACIEYLVYYLTSDLFCHIAARESFGATMTRFKEDKLLNCEIQLPLLEDQYRIVNVLNDVKRIVFLRQQELQALDDLIKARFVEMFGEPVSNSLQLPTMRGDEFFKLSNGKFVPEFKRFESGIPVYGGNGISWFTDETLVCMDTIIVGRVGFQSGNVHYAKGPLWVSDNAMYVSYYNKEKYNLLFLCHLMEHIDFTRYQDAGDLKKITQKPFMAMQFIHPTIEKQLEYTNFVKQIDKSKVVVQKALDEAQLLFDSLMQQYFG